MLGFQRANKANFAPFQRLIRQIEGIGGLVPILQTYDFPNQPVQTRVCKVQNKKRWDGKQNSDKNVQGQDGCTSRYCIQNNKKKYENQREFSC